MNNAKQKRLWGMVLLLWGILPVWSQATDKANEAVQPAPAKAAQPAPVSPSKPKVLPEDARCSQLQLVNIHALGGAFNDIDNIVWRPDGKTLLVDRKNSSKRWEVVELGLDDSVKMRNFSSGRSNSSARVNNGGCAWNPNMKGVIFVGQTESSKEFSRAVPQNGQQCNLWYYDLQSKKYTALTQFQVSLQRPQGVAMPRFSPDGRRLFWCGADGRPSKGLWGERAMYLADFNDRGLQPRLTNLTKFQPGVTHDFYESYGFTPDGERLLFAGVFDESLPWYVLDICTMNLEGGNIVNLTNTPNAWDRYATYSPKGKKILWSSSQGFEIPYMGIGGNRWQLELKSELWIMTSDGKDKRPLTYFNRRGSEHSNLVNGRRAYVGMSAWNKDGNRVAFVVYYDSSLNGGNVDSKLFIGDLIEGRP